MKNERLINFAISFTSLKKEDFLLIYKWFNKPHIQAFYSLRTWTMEEVHQKLTPYLLGTGSMQCYIISINQVPIGYIQCYPVIEHPWENQEIAKNIMENAAGFDFFIGEENYLKKGFGTLIVNDFLKKHIWPSYDYCFVDPDIRNRASLKLFQKCGFQLHKEIQTQDALKQTTTLCLLIKKGSDEEVEASP